ncbi:MAG: hypothetical protein HQK87_07310 [Nitrospinae bacterium]|nr:hypothetical protein [Nitrospinota bacterium]
MVDIILTNPHTGLSQKTSGLIDTGADECAFPLWLAVALGHLLDRGHAKTVTTGNGQAVSYGHTTIIEIPGFSTSEVVVDYLPNLNIPLLGVRSFLSNFVLEVDYPNSVYSLRLPKTTKT